MNRPRTVRDVVRRGSSRLVAGKTSRDVLGGPSSKSLHGRINPQGEWHYRVLLRLRERRLQDRPARLAEVAQLLESHSMDSADSATAEFDRNMALAELSTGQGTLEEIEAAIGRISKGAYGICEATGRPIPAAHLKAVPWTRFARKVEVQLEKKGGIWRTYLGLLSSVHKHLY